MIPIAKPLIGEEEKRAVEEVLNSGMLVSGPKVKEFEDGIEITPGKYHGAAIEMAFKKTPR